ncbi:hypothetical protein [Metabacillus halosaccharovorans]|uniref:hypothetical protein n=1 Tax=Metabacillus halosaccharovorans TaxID=930124 RepID=UPI001C20066D|nr:hypothetical protein [Metabacillus halosaccharovorans]MBU7592210.1 hypothetical protein [Metabacillus halosaccharovorans]
MKTKVTLLIILVVILITLSIVLLYPFPNGEETKETAVNSEPLENYKTLTYIITEVDGNQYFGESVDGKSKIHFHRDRVKYPITDSIKVHDKILAYVESENHIDGIVRVEKIEEEKD